MFDAPLDNLVQMQENLRRLQREKGEADDMLRNLISELQEVKEDNFDLRASMVLFETETKYENEKKMQKRVAALESNLSFMSAELQNAERAKLRAIKEVEELHQKRTIEIKRRDAERRLLANKQRKHATLVGASQSKRTSQYQAQYSQQTTRLPPAPVVETGVQTERTLGDEYGMDDSDNVREENAKLISYLLTGPSRDLLILLNGVVTVQATSSINQVPVEDRTQAPQRRFTSPPSHFSYGSSNNSLNESFQQSASGVKFSQSVFSQLAGKVSARAHASMISVSTENNALRNVVAASLPQELYDVLGKMMTGDVLAVALAPVFVKFLEASADIERTVMCSVIRVMYSVMHNSAHFRDFFQVALSPSGDSSSFVATNQQTPNSIEHPRIALSGLRYTSLNDYLSSRLNPDSKERNKLLLSLPAKTASEQRPICRKLMKALCRVINTNLKEMDVVKYGLCVLDFWADLGLTHSQAPTLEFKPLLTSNVIPSILAAPTSSFMLKTQAVGLLNKLLRMPEVLCEMQSEFKKSLLFHRCAKLLAHDGEQPSVEDAKNLRILKSQIVKLMLFIITNLPSEGIRFVLESTHGFPDEADGYRSIIFFLAQLLHFETFHARSTRDRKELLMDQNRMELIQDSFALLGLLSRYVDMRKQLGGDDQVQTFLGVLFFVSALANDNNSRNDSLVASSRALMAMIKIPGKDQ
ncbi:hypothetical protein CCR75_004436 [Bremia lactucae]|uniref:Uncharacterized protein n=1 Tax=Bremia lactucae TaxID=4779 RepID=A0A976IIE1_BRELC|nr:hypothetical protein CCR75_004436 [Bremia lactucae]